MAARGCQTLVAGAGDLMKREELLERQAQIVSDRFDQLRMQRLAGYGRGW